MSKKYIYLIQTEKSHPYFHDLVTMESDCVVLYWREPRPQPKHAFSAKHPHWSGEIHLHDDGLMERPGIARGTYIFEQHKKLELHWDRWNPEILYYQSEEQCYFSKNRSFKVVEQQAKPSNILPSSWKEIRMPNSTWNSGRNRLLKEALTADPYEYYIFMDDDVVLYDRGTTGENPFRLFEAFLAQFRPAVGYASGSWHEEPYNSGERLCSPHYYDACFNAFRHDTLETLLPYCEDYDDISWWWSQAIIYTVGGLLYEGGNIQNNQIGYLNSAHRSYRKDKSLKRLSIPIRWVGSSFTSLDRALPASPHFEKIMYSVTAGAQAIDKRHLEKTVTLKHPYWSSKRQFWEGVKGSWL